MHKSPCETRKSADGIIDFCEGRPHRAEAFTNASGHMGIKVYVGIGGTTWEVFTATNPSPAELTAIMNHLFMAGMEHEGYNRDCGEPEPYEVD